MQLSDAEVAVAAAEAGAAVVRARFGTSLTRLEKSAMDFATDADVDAERAILEVLHAARPGDACVGEELGASGDGSSARTWLVDPLCGTQNFAARTPLFAVNVALRARGTLGVAAAADPLAGDLFWTDGHTAYQRRHGVDAVLAPSAASRLVDVNIDPPFPNADRFRAVGLLADPAFTASFQPRVGSTTLTLAWVAAGKYAGYVTDGHIAGSVHFSSGIALCRAAGCVVTGLAGQPVHTGIGGLVAAADGQTHGALLASIRRHGDSTAASSM
jgi:myo-inositol-1(or 4)-monophosphatase